MDALSELFDEGLDSLLNAAFSLIFVGTGMLLLDWPLALAVMAGFLPLIWLSAWFQRESAVAYRRTRETIALVIVQFVETFNGIRAVQAFRRERRNDAIFGELNKGYADASLRSMRLLAVYFPGVTLIGNLAVGAVLLYGGVRVIDHAMPVGVLVTFLLLLRRFFEPLQDVSQFYSTFQSAAAALEKLSGVLEEAPSVPEPHKPVPLPRLPCRRGPWSPARAVVDPLRLPGHRGAAAAEPHDPGRADGRTRRRDRGRQDDDREAAGQVLRP